MTTRKVKKKKAGKKAPTRTRQSASTSPLESLVGKDTYSTWVSMLKHLVPHGRTHRLSVVVASMLQDAAARNRMEHPLGERLQNALEGDPDEAMKLIGPTVERLFKDAGVKSKRTSARGERYSIVEQSVIEYVYWHNMPWE